MGRTPRILKTYTAVIVPATEGGYTAHVPAFSGCASQGLTLRSVRANIREAAEDRIWSILAERGSLPIDRGAGRAARRRGARVIRIRAEVRNPLGPVGRRVAPGAPTQETIGRGFSGDDD